MLSSAFDPVSSVMPARVVAWACLVTAVAGLAPSSSEAGAAGGRVIALGDDALLSDAAFKLLPLETTALALNCAAFVSSAGDAPADFLVYSTNSGLTGSTLAATMKSAGYGWTVDASAPLTSEVLAEYDAVFLAGLPGSGDANAAVLAQYVIDGGGVLVCAGTGAFGSDAGAEAAAWNPFLEQFGLLFVGASFPTPELVEITLLESRNPVGLGVHSIAWGFGQAVFESFATVPLTDTILGDFLEWGLFPSGVIGTSRTACAGVCPADLDNNGVVDGADLGVLLGSWGVNGGEAGPAGDLNCDSVVDGVDLGLMLGAWGPCVGAGS